MTKTAQNFEMWQGDTKQLRISVTGSDNAGYSLTGASLVYIVEVEPKSGSLIRKTTANDVSISGSTVTVTLNPIDTLQLEGLYYHEIQALDVLGRVATIMVGNVKINKSGAN